MTKVRVQIANGYVQGQIRKTVEDNSMLSPVEAVTDWIKAKYGSWIERTLETTAYVIGDVNYWDRGEREFGGNFTISFDSPNHEDYFVRNVGGKIVPLEPTDG